MKTKSPVCRPLSLPARLALCVGLGTALTASNGLPVGVAVAAGLFVALAGKFPRS
jgi:hypothetical protein